MPVIKHITLEEELKKNPELKLSDIHILREWCKKQPHLPKIQDIDLAIFLYYNYYNIELTKSKIENYYTYRTHAPELFSNRDILKEKQLRGVFKNMSIGILHNTTKEGYVILIGDLVDKDPSHFFHNELLNALLMIYDEITWTYGSIPGIICVVNSANVTMGHLARVNLVSIKKILRYYQDAMPIYLKGFHVINTSPVIKIFFKMIKPFLNEEIIKLIHFHTSTMDIHKYFPIELLPNEFGGKAGAIQEITDANFKKIEDLHEWFLKDEKNNRVNESLRIGKSKTSSDLFSVDGSFKKIEFD